MASTLALSMPAPSLALSEHRTLRMTTLFLLYVAQGLPFGLIDFALLAWLAQNGASAAAIGSILAMMTLPWAFMPSSRWGGVGHGSLSRSSPWLPPLS
jgi:MFS transporter, PAT family, beta-lactamase induction signal transducer AmpG